MITRKLGRHGTAAIKRTESMGPIHSTKLVEVSQSCFEAWVFYEVGQALAGIHTSRRAAQRRIRAVLAGATVGGTKS